MAQATQNDPEPRTQPRISGDEQRAIGYIEGRLEGLATKEYVAEKIDEQTRQLTDEIKGIRSTRLKAIGVAVGSVLFLLHRRWQPCSEFGMVQPFKLDTR